MMASGDSPLNEFLYAGPVDLDTWYDMCISVRWWFGA